MRRTLEVFHRHSVKSCAERRHILCCRLYECFDCRPQVNDEGGRQANFARGVAGAAPKAALLAEAARQHTAYFPGANTGSSSCRSHAVNAQVGEMMRLAAERVGAQQTRFPGAASSTRQIDRACSRQPGGPQARANDHVFDASGEDLPTQAAVAGEHLPEYIHPATVVVRDYRTEARRLADCSAGQCREPPPV